MSIRVFDYFVLTLLYVICTLLEKRMRFVSCLIYFPLYSCVCYSTIMLINFLERHPLTPFICMLHLSHDKRPPDTSDTLDFGLGYPAVVIVVVRWRMKQNEGQGGGQGKYRNGHVEPLSATSCQCVVCMLKSTFDECYILFRNGFRNIIKWLIISILAVILLCVITYHTRLN